MLADQSDNIQERAVEAREATSHGSLCRDDGTTTYLQSNVEEDYLPDALLSPWRGRFLLLLVAFLYGTLNVALRYVLRLKQPPTASVLSTTRGWMAVLCFGPIYLQEYWGCSKKKHNHSRDSSIRMAVEQGPQDEMDPILSRPSPDTSTVEPGNNHRAPRHLLLLRVSLELAIWNFCSQSLLNIGLESTPSGRASFLTTLSVVVIPILVVVGSKCRQKISVSVWIACWIALAGLALLGLAVPNSEPVNNDPRLSTARSLLAAAAESLSWGDVLIVGSALAWSMYVIRLTHWAVHAHSLSPIQVQGLKTLWLACLYSLWALLSVVASNNGPPPNAAAAADSAWYKDWTAWLVLFYSALGPGAIADWMQQVGQGYLQCPSESNLWLSLEPVFTALLGWTLLNEHLSRQEWMGGSLLVVAALVASQSNDNGEEEQDYVGAATPHEEQNVDNGLAAEGEHETG